MATTPERQKKLIKGVALFLFFFVATSFDSYGLCDSTASDKIGSGASLSGSQANTFAPDVSLAYTQAIAEYIKAVRNIDTLSFDTLFIGNPDLLPEIKLPEAIEGKKIILASENVAKRKPEQSKSFVLINIAWAAFEKNPVEFKFVTFHKDYHPQHECYVYLKHNPVNNKFTLASEVMFKHRWAYLTLNDKAEASAFQNKIVLCNKQGTITAKNGTLFTKKMQPVENNKFQAEVGRLFILESNNERWGLKILEADVKSNFLVKIQLFPNE